VTLSAALLLAGAAAADETLGEERAVAMARAQWFEGTPTRRSRRSRQRPSMPLPNCSPIRPRRRPAHRRRPRGAWAPGAGWLAGCV